MDNPEYHQYIADRAERLNELEDKPFTILTDGTDIPNNTISQISVIYDDFTTTTGMYSAEYVYPSGVNPEILKLDTKYEWKMEGF